MMLGMDDEDFSYRDALPNGPAHRRAAGLNPGNRFETLRLHVLGEEIDRQCLELTAAGVPVTVNIAPIILGLTDVELPEILKAIAEAGARRASWVLLRLPYQIKELFLDWLKRCVHPDRARKVESLIRQASGGKLYQASSPDRRRGRGPLAEQIAQTFDVFTRKYGLNRDIRPLSTAHFRRPEIGGQMGLFES